MLGGLKAVTLFKLCAPVGSSCETLLLAKQLEDYLTYHYFAILPFSNIFIVSRKSDRN